MKRWWQSRTIWATAAFLAVLASSTALTLTGHEVPTWIVGAGSALYAVLVGLLRVGGLRSRPKSGEESPGGER